MRGIALRSDFDAGDLRRTVRQSENGAQTRRLLALAAIYEGASRSEAAKIGGVTPQIVRDWGVKFNADGPDGLAQGVGTPCPAAAFTQPDEVCRRARGARVLEVGCGSGQATL